MMASLPRLMIAAPRSGGGKTTLSCGLLQVFKNRGLKPAAFKCGPDFIDPMFHRRVVGAKSGNLDPFFTDEATLRSLLVRGAQGAQVSLLEGVMGYYDGIHIASPEGSSYQVARATRTPVILVVEARGAALSLAALIEGFAGFQPDAAIRGVILNACSESLYTYLAPSLERHTKIPVIGYLPYDEGIALESRHLGLVSAAEVEGLKDKIGRLASVLEQTIDIEGLLALAAKAPDLGDEAFATARITDTKPRLGIAQDKAFNFYYEENLRMLEELGVELVSFSPLEDTALPADLSGLYLGGGYPELFGEQLSQNHGMLAALRSAIASGMPVVAECGAFLYLQEAIVDGEGRAWPMLGILPGKSCNANSLKQFGYLTMTAREDNLYCKKGQSIRAHEFHYWHSDCGGDAFRAEKPHRERSWPCMVVRENLVAGFPHLYYPAHPVYAANFVQAIMDYQKEGL